MTILLLASLAVQDPAPFPYHSVTPARIEAFVDSQLSAGAAMLERLLAQRGPRTVANTLRPWDDMRIRVNGARAATFLSGIHPDAAIRAAATGAERKIEAFNNRNRLDPRIYRMITAIDTTTADAEARFYVGKLLQLFRESGADRDSLTRSRIAGLRSALSDLTRRFLANIQEDSTRSGPPSGPQSREQTFLAANSRSPGNRVVLDSMLRLRHELAVLYGASTFAEWQLRETMAGSPVAVRDFLAEVQRRSDDVHRRMIAGAADRLRASGAVVPTPLPIAEFPGLNLQTGSLENGRSLAALRPWLPYPAIRDSLLALSRELVGVDFRPAPDLTVWHPSVEPYRVYDDGKLVAYVYLDLHPRPRKVPRAASAGLIRSGVRDRVVPMIVVDGSMGRAGAGESSLMGPQGVITLFHEFGHVLHFILSVRTWWGTSGLPGEFDFREVPSSFFEQLARDPVVMRRITRHFQTGAPMPDSLLELLSTVQTGVPFGAIWRSRISLALHEGASVNADSVARATFMESLPPGPPLLALPDAPIHPQWSFWHLAGYQAAYYTYPWSNVISADLLSQFRRGLLDTAMTRRYRREILEPGSSRPARSMVEAFLGRPVSLEAWAATIR